MNEVLKKAQSSPEAALQLIVDTQYDSILERALGAKIVNSDVGRENLYMMVLKLAQTGDMANLNYVLGGQVDYDGLPADYADALRYALSKSNTPAGQLRMARMETAGNGGNGGNGWSSSNTNTAINALSGLIGTIGGWFTGDEPAPAPTPGPGGPVPGPAQAPQTDYMPWILGGAALLIIAVVVIVLLRKK
jgi:hypothetical protein